LGAFEESQGGTTQTKATIQKNKNKGRIQQLSFHHKFEKKSIYRIALNAHNKINVVKYFNRAS